MKKLILISLVLFIAVASLVGAPTGAIIFAWFTTAILTGIFVYQHDAEWDNKTLYQAFEKDISRFAGKMCLILVLLFAPIFALIAVTGPLQVEDVR